jgi:KDO2-lipid IV(A) lauroyltransferase
MFKGVNMRLKPAGDFVVYFAVRLVVCIIQALPIEVCQRLARLLAVLACDVVRVRFGVVDDNLKHAFPAWTADQRRAAARGMWEHLLLLVCELTQVPRKIRDTNWHRRVKLTNIEAMVEVLLQPRPKVVLTGHFGNFEVGGYMCALLGFPTHTIVRPLDNPLLDRFLSRFRLAAGQRILPKRGSAWQVQDVLDGNGTLGVLGDQAAGWKGCRVEFFNRTAYCHKAIAVFALANKAPIMVTTTTRRQRPLQFEIVYHGLFDAAAPDQQASTVTDVTQWYCNLLEEAIRRQPAQYWWVHRLWKVLKRHRRTKDRRKEAGSSAPDERAGMHAMPAPGEFTEGVVPLPPARRKKKRRKSA